MLERSHRSVARPLPPLRLPVAASTICRPCWVATLRGRWQVAPLRHATSRDSVNKSPATATELESHESQVEDQPQGSTASDSPVVVRQFHRRRSGKAARSRKDSPSPISSDSSSVRPWARQAGKLPSWMVKQSGTHGSQVAASRFRGGTRRSVARAGRRLSHRRHLQPLSLLLGLVPLAPLIMSQSQMSHGHWDTRRKTETGTISIILDEGATSGGILSLDKKHGT